MKIQILSDLHGSKPQISKEAELLIYAGDIDVGPKKVQDYFASVRQETEAPIIWVIGNHEYYGNVFPNVWLEYKKATNEIPGVFLLENHELGFGDFQILGCTLWTDYDKGRCIGAAIYGMNDFDCIRKEVNEKFVNTHPNDFMQAHYHSVLWLNAQLAACKSVNRKVIVVTHHMPSFSLISNNYKGSPLNGAFAVDLDQMFTDYEPVLWVYGHTHGFKDVNLANTRFVCNPFGYKGERTHYKQKYIVEI